jgi:hypothetical protein
MALLASRLQRLQQLFRASKNSGALEKGGQLLKESTKKQALNFGENEFNLTGRTNGAQKKKVAQVIGSNDLRTEIDIVDFPKIIPQLLDTFQDPEFYFYDVLEPTEVIAPKAIMAAEKTVQLSKQNTIPTSGVLTWLSSVVHGHAANNVGMRFSLTDFNALSTRSNLAFLGQYKFGFPINGIYSVGGQAKFSPSQFAELCLGADVDTLLVTRGNLSSREMSELEIDIPTLKYKAVETFNAHSINSALTLQVIPQSGMLPMLGDESYLENSLNLASTLGVTRFATGYLSSPQDVLDTVEAINQGISSGMPLPTHLTWNLSISSDIDPDPLTLLSIRAAMHQLHEVCPGIEQNILSRDHESSVLRSMVMRADVVLEQVGLISGSRIDHPGRSNEVGNPYQLQPYVDSLASTKKASSFQQEFSEARSSVTKKVGQEHGTTLDQSSDATEALDDTPKLKN